MRTPHRWRLPVLAAAALALGTAAGGGTLAAWNGASGAPGAAITAGGLDASGGEPTWTETSADVSAAPHEIDPETFLVRQGDAFDADYPFSITAEGDNMRIAVDVDWSTAPQLPAGTTAELSLLDASGAVLVSGLAVGADQEIVSGIDLTTGAVLDYTLRVSLDFAGLDDRFGAADAAQTADLGDFAVELRQIRTGGSFE